MVGDLYQEAQRFHRNDGLQHSGHLRHWLVLFRVLLFYHLNVNNVLAARNITVDDHDPSINYSGVWNLKPSPSNGLDFGGTHMVTTDPNGTASFKFTGIAIYVLSPLQPYTVNMTISLDSGPKTLVDLTDHSDTVADGSSETVQYHVVWKATGLPNTQHNLEISVGVGQPFAVVDRLIYTSDATELNVRAPLPFPQSPTSTSSEPVTTSSTSTSSHSTTASSTSSATPSKKSGLSKGQWVGISIAISIGVSILAGILRILCGCGGDCSFDISVGV